MAILISYNILNMSSASRSFGLRCSRILRISL